MSEDIFWELIHKSKKESESTSEQVEKLSEMFSTLAPKEVLRFQRILDKHLTKLNTHPLWAVAYLLRGGCSDDGFEYFRGWVVLQGLESTLLASSDLEAFARVCDIFEDQQSEQILSLALSLYEDLTDKTANFTPKSMGNTKGKKWKEEELPLQYSKVIEILRERGIALSF